MKICFLSWHFKTPQIFLDYLRPMTPGRSGKWKDMEAITDPESADFVVIFDGYNGKYPKNRALFYGQHPELFREPKYRSFRKYENHEKKAAFPLDQYVNAGEWWIDYDYDTLVKLDPPKKTKDFCFITTYQTHKPMYTQRITFAEWLTKATKDYDLYGRPEDKFRANSLLTQVYRGSLGSQSSEGETGGHTKGKNMLLDYRYSIEVDVGPTKNYFSERFYDSILLWTMPLYWGSNNVHEYIPQKAFHYIDIENPTEIYRVIDIVKGGTRESNIQAIAEARDLLLNKYQTWACVYNHIKGLDK